MTNQQPVIIHHTKEYRGTHDADIQVVYTLDKDTTLAQLEDLLKNESDWLEIRMAFNKIDKS